MGDTLTLDSLQDPARDLRARFEQAIESARRPLWRFCVGLTGSAWDGEDLAQETVVRALGKLHQFGQILEPRAYLFRIAANAWIDQCRRARPAANIDDLADALPSVDTGTPAAGLMTLQQLVRLLPPRQRVVYLLIEAFAYPAADVAAMLGTTEGAVKALLNRARARIRATRHEMGRASVVRHVHATSPVLRRYLDAFNRRDVAALAALFHEDATSQIVGDWEEQGLETMRRFSLAFWAEGEASERAELARVDGREVVLVFERHGDGTEALSSMVALDAGDRITRQRWYFFCPELLEYVALGAGVAAVPHGYRYVPPTD